MSEYLVTERGYPTEVFIYLKNLTTGPLSLNHILVACDEEPSFETPLSQNVTRVPLINNPESQLTARFKIICEDV